MVGGIENEGESMPRTRKSHPPSLKAKVAIEATKAHKTTAQIAQMFGIHPTQVGGWKKQALAREHPDPVPHGAWHPGGNALTLWLLMPGVKAQRMGS
jgi:transposase-like protein